jgi:hypothetical protein
MDDIGVWERGDAESIQRGLKISPAAIGYRNTPGSVLCLVTLLSQRNGGQLFSVTMNIAIP